MFVFGGAYTAEAICAVFITWEISGTTGSASLIVVSGGYWHFYRDEYYKGDYWDLGPSFNETSSPRKGPL